MCFSGDTMELICKYDLGRDHIYSVKWYKVGTVQYSTVQYSSDQFYSVRWYKVERNQNLT